MNYPSRRRETAEEFRHPESSAHAWSLHSGGLDRRICDPAGHPRPRAHVSDTVCYRAEKDCELRAAAAKTTRARISVAQGCKTASGGTEQRAETTLFTPAT